MSHYLFNLEIIKCFIFGNTNNKSVTKFLKATLKDDYLDFMHNHHGIKFAGDVIPQSGFFAVLDFSSIKGKKYGDHIINNEDDLLYYLLRNANVKFITGQSMGWPNKEDLIARITFSINKKDLAHRLNLINKALNNLTD